MSKKRRRGLPPGDKRQLQDLVGALLAHHAGEIIHPWLEKLLRAIVCNREDGLTAKQSGARLDIDHRVIKAVLRKYDDLEALERRNGNENLD